MSRVLLGFAALIALSGCGLRGGLDRPPPMFGAERARYEAEQKRKAEAEAAAKAAAQSPAVSETASGRQRTEVPVAAAEPAAPETLQPTPPTSPFQRPN
jgi:predicted small lipoprotein YifL